MNTLDIVLIDIICYMGGLFTGLGICFKYKHDLLVLTNDIQAQTSEGPPIMASAPTISEVISPMKEIIIRTNEI